MRIERPSTFHSLHGINKNVHVIFLSLLSLIHKWFTGASMAKGGLAKIITVAGSFPFHWQEVRQQGFQGD